MVDLLLLTAQKQPGFASFVHAEASALLPCVCDTAAASAASLSAVHEGGPWLLQSATMTAATAAALARRAVSFDVLRITARARGNLAELRHPQAAAAAAAAGAADAAAAACASDELCADVRIVSPGTPLTTKRRSQVMQVLRLRGPRQQQRRQQQQQQQQQQPSASPDPVARAVTIVLCHDAHSGALRQCFMGEPVVAEGGHAAAVVGEAASGGGGGGGGGGGRGGGDGGNGSATGMPPRLSVLVCNLARVRRRAACLDPFCGAGTLLQAARALGASLALGADVALPGGGGGWGAADAVRANIWHGSLRAATAGGGTFDCIVADPPFGRREPRLDRFGRPARAGSGGASAVERTAAANAILRPLLELAAAALVPGGRAVLTAVSFPGAVGDWRVGGGEAEAEVEAPLTSVAAVAAAAAAAAAVAVAAAAAAAGAMVAPPLPPPQPLACTAGAAPDAAAAALAAGAALRLGSVLNDGGAAARRARSCLAVAGVCRQLWAKTKGGGWTVARDFIVLEKMMQLPGDGAS